MRAPEHDDPMTQTMTDADQECQHTWHTCGRQIQPGHHKCSHLFDDINSDPPFWKAVDQITYRCDNCGVMKPHLFNQDQRIISPTMPSSHVHQQTTHLTKPAKEPNGPLSPRNLAGNPDYPQAVIFLASITDVMMGS